MKNYCITLSHRGDRRILAEKEFAEQGLDVEFYVAEKNKVRGWMGCRDSHLAVLEIAKNYKEFAVFEDDVVFDLYLPDILNSAMSQLPSDWDMLYLGANLQSPPEIYSSNLFKIHDAWCAHAIIYNNGNDSVVDYILANKPNINKYDVFLSYYVHPWFNCFVVYPMLCDQRESLSDICKNTDVSQIRINYNKFISHAI